MARKLSMPQSNPRLSFVINDFSGGMVNNVNDVKMKDNQSPDMLNMQFRIDGLLQKRPGTLHRALLSNNEVKHITSFEPSPNDYRYIVQNQDGIFYYNEPNIEGSSRILPTVSKTVNYATFMGKLFFVDGLNVWYYDRDVKTSYKLVNPPSDFVPTPKPATKGVVKSKSASMQYIDATGATKTFNYKETWYEPCEFEMEDGFKGTNIVPINPTLITVNKDRLYISGCSHDPNMVYISDILQPEYFPVSLPIQTPPTDDYITALTTYNDCVIVGRRDTIYSLFGNTNRSDSIDQYRLVEVNCHTGFANARCSSRIHHMMFFVGSDGNMYKLNTPQGNVSSVLSTSRLNLFIDLTLPPFNLTKSDVRYAEVCFDSTDELWYIQIADITLVYNYKLKAWTRYNNINATSFFMYNNELMFGKRNGSVYSFASKEGNQKYYDEYYDPEIKKTIELPVVAYWTSRNMDFNTPARVKQFRDTYITSESFEDYNTTVNVKYEVDYVDIAQTYKIENEISRWNSAIFDKNKFVSRNIDRSLPLMINRRGRTLKVFYGCGYEYWGAKEVLPVPGIVPEFQMVYVNSEDKLYVRVPRREGFENKNDKYFMPLPSDEMNQSLLVHNIMGIYELKGYR